MSQPRRPGLDAALENNPSDGTTAEDDADRHNQEKQSRPKEIGGRPGPDPTRYGDWEKNGRCIDF
jgi:hypothetical protein